MTERDEIVQAKDRELAQAQQQLRQLRQQVATMSDIIEQGHRNWGYTAARDSGAP